MDTGPYTRVYHGPDRECIIDQLTPGATYSFRVASESKAGIGKVELFFVIFTVIQVFDNSNSKSMKIFFSLFLGTLKNYLRKD